MLRVAALVAATMGVAATATMGADAAVPSFPAPPPGATVFSRQLGHDALALAVVAEPGKLLLQASIINAQGTGATGEHVMLGVSNGTSRRASVCGAGCYRATVPMKGRPINVHTTVDGVAWDVRMPTKWPAPSGATLMRQAARAWHSLRSLTDFDRFATGSGAALITDWEIEAPNRVAYQVHGGGDAVIIGSRRWDRPAADADWVESPQTPVKQPTPFWVSVTDAHVLGTAKVEGRRAWQVSFFDPSTPAWFDVMVDQSTQRVLDMRMIATAHFMHDTYSHFNATPAVLPPAQ